MSPSHYYVITQLKSTASMQWRNPFTCIKHWKMLAMAPNYWESKTVHIICMISKWVLSCTALLWIILLLLNRRQMNFSWQGCIEGKLWLFRIIQSSKKETRIVFNTLSNFRLKMWIVGQSFGRWLLLSFYSASSFKEGCPLVSVIKGSLGISYCVRASV